MIRRSLASTTTLAGMIAVLLIAQAPVAGQAQSPATKSAQAKATTGGEKSWTPPRTPDGKPDLQGVWTNNTVTPLERPKELAGKEFYTEAELQALAKQERELITISPSSAWTGARLSSPGTGGRQSLWGRRGRFLP